MRSVNSRKLSFRSPSSASDGANPVNSRHLNSTPCLGSRVSVANGLSKRSRKMGSRDVTLVAAATETRSSSLGIDIASLTTIPSPPSSSGGHNAPAKPFGQRRTVIITEVATTSQQVRIVAHSRQSWVDTERFIYIIKQVNLTIGDVGSRPNCEEVHTFNSVQAAYSPEPGPGSHLIGERSNPTLQRGRVLVARGATVVNQDRHGPGEHIVRVAYSRTTRSPPDHRFMIINPTAVVTATLTATRSDGGRHPAPLGTERGHGPKRNGRASTLPEYPPEPRVNLSCYSGESAVCFSLPNSLLTRSSLDRQPSVRASTSTGARLDIGAGIPLPQASHPSKKR